MTPGPNYKEASYIIVLGIVISVLPISSTGMQCAKDSQTMWITVPYLDYLSRVDELDMLVMPMRAYDLVRGLPR